MTVLGIDTTAKRVPTQGTEVHPMFPRRWSPRAMTGEPLTTEVISTLIEAARWAPSCFNSQPWRFACATRGSPCWMPLLDTLVEGNQSWARNAGVLMAVISRREFEQGGGPAPTHAFDTGAAWMSLALQAAHMGLVAHGMRGFDVDEARSVLQVPDGYELHAIIAVGHPGAVDDLPEKYRQRETPSERKPLDAIAFDGNFAQLTD